MQHDALIIGGGFAGLAAATYLARARRNVRVLDTGTPRNRFADASHGFLGQDGSNPGDILATARAQLQAYDTVELTNARASEARVIEDGFAVSLSSGEQITARKLILAFGLHDELPDLPGLQERWGKSVLHCPYCHGFEFSDRQLGVLYRTPMSVHQAQLITEWGPTTLYLNGAELSGTRPLRFMRAASGSSRLPFWDWREKERTCPRSNWPMAGAALCPRSTSRRARV